MAFDFEDGSNQNAIDGAELDDFDRWWATLGSDQQTCLAALEVGSEFPARHIAGLTSAIRMGPSCAKDDSGSPFRVNARVHAFFATKRDH